MPAAETTSPVNKYDRLFQNWERRISSLRGYPPWRQMPHACLTRSVRCRLYSGAKGQCSTTRSKEHAARRNRPAPASSEVYQHLLVRNTAVHNTHIKFARVLNEYNEWTSENEKHITLVIVLQTPALRCQAVPGEYLRIFMSTVSFVIGP